MRKKIFFQRSELVFQAKNIIQNMKWIILVHTYVIYILLTFFYGRFFFSTGHYAKKLLLWLNSSTMYIRTWKIISNPVHWPTDFWTSWPCQFNKNGSNLKGNRQMFCIQSFCQIYKFLIKFRNFVAFLTNNQEGKGFICTCRLFWLKKYNRLKKIT